MKLHVDGTVEGTPEELASYAYHKDILDRLVYGDNPEAKKDSIWGKGYFERDGQIMHDMVHRTEYITPGVNDANKNGNE
ncbi:hypothetical protein [Paenibacillus sp. P32E]|uniref:hypothetical protein n=1 Tax=Paenibacillus sp. P32E TaxID=1349434 RepID=UPI00093E8FD0|nr:hypothetical protein [Paenibacillus sp. P32E]OKP91411.1 hypothetical protein A3848_09915 [Paenibacillus sp. P32E]